MFPPVGIVDGPSAPGTHPQRLPVLALRDQRRSRGENAGVRGADDAPHLREVERVRSRAITAGDEVFCAVDDAEAGGVPVAALAAGEAVRFAGVCFDELGRHPVVEDAAGAAQGAEVTEAEVLGDCGEELPWEGVEAGLDAGWRLV